MENLKTNLVWASLILSVAIVASAGIASSTFYKVRAMDSSLSVTGSAKLQVRADSVKWQSGISRMVTQETMKDGYAGMAKDLKAVKSFFKENGIEEKLLDISPVFVDQQYNYGSNNTGPTQYNLRQTIEIQSKDIDKITGITKNTQSLIDKGVLFSPNAPEYYYTKLPETRIALLGEAVKDATARAEKIAESGGKKVGSLKEASVGVTQVLPVNSVEINDYGTYDTSKIDKEVMITVKASFNLE